jgi:hypothetical protein
MAFSNDPLSPPEADDFQRMGLRRMEFRPPVIRRAIIRSAQPLVLMHLRSPSAEVERLLVNVMLSGYRVLDPRRRDDSNQRVMLGRIHPQLVEEAVYLAQKKPGQTSSEAGAPAGNASAGNPAVGVANPGAAANLSATASAVAGSEADEAGLRITADFAPIAERDWLESAEANLGVTDRLLSSGFAPEMNPSDRFLDVTGSVAWDATLIGSDLMVQPTYQRIYRAIRRRLARASAVSLVSGAMLAASILLVMTWRTTAWIRSIGERRMSVEMAESVLSPEEVARIAAAVIPDGSEKLAESSSAATQTPIALSPLPAGSAGAAGSAVKTTEIGKVDPSAAGVKSVATAAGASGSTAGANELKPADLANAAVPGPTLMPKAELPMLPLVTNPSVDPSLDSRPAAENAVPAIAASAVIASSPTKPETPNPGVAMAAGDAAGATDADATKKAADERLGMELLGLAEPVVAANSAAVAKVAKLPSLPDENLLGSARLRVESAARAIRIADGGSSLVGRAAAASGVKIFRRVAGESAQGSPERYVATLLAGQTAALAGLPSDANRAIEDLTVMFDIDRDAALMRLVRWMAADVVSNDELRSVGTWIDGQLRASMLAGELDSAGELVAVMQEIGSKHRDDELRAEAKLWRDVLVISQRYADAAARVEAAGEAGEASAEDQGSAGRFWAQVRRDWHRALPHFAACSTPKFTKLAGIELLGGQMIDAEDAEELADGYLAEAKRAKGWLGESFALHSHDLLTLAAANSDRATALELNRRASAVKVDYPRAFIPADDRVASSDDSPNNGKGGSGNEPATKPASSTGSATDGASSPMAVPDRGPAQMLGRLRIGGQDAAVLIRYQAGMPVTRKIVDQLLVGLVNAGGMPDAATAKGQIELEFVGALSVDGPKTVTFHLAGNAPGGNQTLSINGREVPINAASPRSPKRFEVDLMRGEYLVRWTTTLDDGDQLSLRAVDESSGNLVPIFAPPTTIANHPGALPTRLRVNLITAE